MEVLIIILISCINNQHRKYSFSLLILINFTVVGFEYFYVTGSAGTERQIESAELRKMRALNRGSLPHIRWMMVTGVR